MIVSVMMIIFTMEVHSILHTNYVTFDSITNKEQIMTIFQVRSSDSCLMVCLWFHARLMMIVTRHLTTLILTPLSRKLAFR